MPCHVGEIARSSGGQEGEVVTGGKVTDKMDHLVMLIVEVLRRGKAPGPFEAEE